MMELVDIKTEIDLDHVGHHEEEVETKDEKDPFSQIQYVASAKIVTSLAGNNISRNLNNSWPSRLATVDVANINILQQTKTPESISQSNKWFASLDKQIDGDKVIKKRKIEESSNMIIPRVPPSFETKVNSIASLLEREPSQSPTESKLLKQLLSMPVSQRVPTPSAVRKSIETKKVMPSLVRISQPSIDDKEAIDMLTGFGGDVSENDVVKEEIVTKPPAFANKIDAITRMFGTQISSGHSLPVSSVVKTKCTHNCLESTEQLENYTIEDEPEPNGDDILARLNEPDEAKQVESNEAPIIKIKIEILDKEDDEPLNLVKRKVKSVEHLYNSSQYSLTNLVETSAKKEIQPKKNKIKSKSGAKSIQIDETEERYKKYDPKIEITKLMALLLKDKEYNPSVITWVDPSQGKFKITNTSEFAKLRGKQRSSNTYMEFKHVNRNIRYHTHAKAPGKGTGKLLSIPGQRLTYQFTKEMEHDWRTELAENLISKGCKLY